ncbi:nickel transporter [Providencia rettgeri]
MKEKINALLLEVLNDYRGDDEDGGVDDDTITSIKDDLEAKLNQLINIDLLRDRLEIIFDYEKDYLGLIREHKEEIKFVNSLQEDLRKERAKFFSSVLDEVSTVLKSAQVSPEVSSQWIIELVDSYTKSLDSSSRIVSENTLSRFNELKEESCAVVDDLSNEFK